jgi:PAS domain S-box-containing protein
MTTPADLQSADGRSPPAAAPAGTPGRAGAAAAHAEADATEPQQAEASLRLYEAVTNSITDPVSVVDEARVYRMVNDAWCRMFGLERPQVLGRRAEEILPATVLTEERRAAAQRCHDTQRPQRVRAVLDQPGLRGAVIETTYYPFGGGADARGLAGGGRCVVIVTRDVSEQEAAARRLAASEQELRAVLESSPGYIHAIDEESRYVYMNQRLADVLGLDPRDVVGRHVRDVLGEERLRRNEAEIERARSGERVVAQRRFLVGAAREPLDIELIQVAGPRQADGRQTFYGFGTDVTARKRAEAALIAARDEAEHANRAKTQFLANMSHELRTPLNAVLGFAQLLLTAQEPPLADAQGQQVREILRGGRHLLNLINDILDLSRIEAGELIVELGPVDIAECLGACVTLLQPLAHQHDVAVHVAPAGGLLAQADRTRLGQVLLNLLSNAIKYNRSGGTVWLEARSDGDAVRVAVRDTGRGLSAQQAGRLFQPFERLAAGATAIDGVGIGLAVSRRLMHAMGGDIGVDSQPGQGSTFWIRLPRAVAAARHDEGLPARPQPDDAGEAPGTDAAAVLCIEDNPVNLLLMQAMLEHVPGVRAVSAATAREGLQMARENPPALVLTDIVMPQMDGFELLRQLRADPATRAIPVIAVSASAMPADVQAGMAAGFDGYLTKPLDLQRLCATVQAALQRRTADPS